MGEICLDNHECAICGSLMREGDYGEARWICTNDSCIKSDPFWPNNQLRLKLKPLNDEINRVSVFSDGKIEMYTARWIGEGSFKVIFKDGRSLECHINAAAEVFPDVPEINQEIRSKFMKLIELRTKLFSKLNE